MGKKEHADTELAADDDDLFGLGDDNDDLDDGETDVNIAGLDDDVEADDTAADSDDAEFDLAPPVKTAPPKAAPRATTKAAKAAPAPAAAALGEKALGMTADIPIQVVAVLGKKSMTMHDLLQLELGQLIDLGQPVSTTVDLVANGKLVAKGELIDIDGQLGVKIIRMVR